MRLHMSAYAYAYAKVLTSPKNLKESNHNNNLKINSYTADDVKGIIIGQNSKFCMI